MFEKRLLFLTKGLVTVFSWKGGEVRGSPQRFEATEEGRKGLARYLMERRRIPLSMLVDLVEEEFRTETQPHVYGPDRSALVERRLHRAFASTPFRRLFIQGREKKSGRRDDITLLSGISESDLIMPWVEVIRENGLLLAGIDSLPMVSTRLLKVLDVVTPATLMVSWQSTSGLRFSFFCGNHLKMSRMAPVPGQDPESYAQLFIAELERTKVYLNSLRLLPKGVSLKVVLFTSPEMLDVVRPLCHESATITFNMITVNAVARKLGIKVQITTPFSDSLFIQILGQGSVANHYATVDMTSAYYSWNVRNILYLASILLLIVAVVGGGGYTLKGYAYWVQWQDMEQWSKEMLVRYSAVTQQKFPTTIAPSDVRQSVQMIDFIKNLEVGPAWAMKKLAHALVGFANLRLDDLTWKGPIHPDTLELLSSPEVGRKKGDKKKSGGGGSRTKVLFSPEDRLEMVEFKGEVEQVKGDVDAARELVSRFTVELLADPEVGRVDPLEIPNAQGAEGVVAGDLMGVKKVDVASAPFALRVIFRRKPVGYQD